ncbi:MAG: hypothetical protein IJ642_06025 [Oscillospiraceae bacterium]|nr:hypothetical protein [Oscillospiraceae bacterium]MBR1528839.1 hypothetical protein [Oscillospiraceae bacterium]
MVIEIHGFPGAGKPTVLTMIAQRSLQGKETLDIPPCDTVLTSFPCPGCYELDFELLGKRNFHNCLMILDEVSMYADSRKFKSFSDSLLYFFKFHRHHNINLVWASQSANDADKKIREVTQCSYIIDRYFMFTAIKPILKAHTVRSGDPDIKFELAPPVLWKWCYRPRWYKYFDSYSVKPLPEPELVLWSEPVPRVSLLDKIKMLGQKPEPSPALCLPDLPEHQSDQREQAPDQKDTDLNQWLFEDLNHD